MWPPPMVSPVLESVTVQLVRVLQNMSSLPNSTTSIAGVALYYAGGDVNAKVIRRNPSVRDDNVHLGLLVGAGLVLHCGSYLLRLRVGCTHLGGLAYNAEVVTYLLPEWF